MGRRYAVGLVVVLAAGCVFTELKPPDTNPANNRNNENNLNNTNNVDRLPLNSTGISCPDGEDRFYELPIEDPDPVFAPGENTVLGVGIPLEENGQGVGTVSWAQVDGEGFLFITVSAFREGTTGDLEIVQSSWRASPGTSPNDRIVEILPSFKRACPNDKAVCPMADRYNAFEAMVLLEDQVLSCFDHTDGGGEADCVQENGLTQEFLTNGVFPPSSVEFGFAAPNYRFLDLDSRVVLHVVGGSPRRFSTVSIGGDNAFTPHTSREVKGELPPQYATDMLWGLDRESNGFPYLGIVSSFADSDQIDPIMMALDITTGQYAPLEDQEWSIPDDVTPSPDTFSFVQQQTLAGGGQAIDPNNTEVSFGYVAADDSGDFVVFGEMGSGGFEPEHRELEVDGGNITQVSGMRSMDLAGSGTLTAPFLVVHGEDSEKLTFGLWDTEDELEYYDDLAEDAGLTNIRQARIRGLWGKIGNIFLLAERDGKTIVGLMPLNIDGGIEFGMCP